MDSQHEIEEFLSPYNAEIRAVCDYLRDLIKEAVPGAQEKLYRGWQLLGYRTPNHAGDRYFCFISPYGDHARLGFEWGVLLADEDRLLEGEGTQVRYFSVRDTADFQPELLKAYIVEAAEVAALSKDAKAVLAIQRQEERERPFNQT